MDHQEPIASRRESRAPTLRLIITGERLRRRHLVLIDGASVWLPAGLFAVLCRLVCYRCATRTGFVVESPLQIYRLRQVMRAVRADLDSIIQTGDGQEYRIAPGIPELGASPDVAELPAPGILSDRERQILLRLAANPPMKSI